MRAFWRVLCGLLASAWAHAQSLPLEHPAHTPWQPDLREASWQQGGELVVEGVNSSQQSVIVVLRVDDEQSHDYASRFNREWHVPPGPFVLRQNLRGLSDGRKRTMLPEQLQRLWLFHADGQAPVALKSVYLHRQVWPDGVLAWDFGDLHSPCATGFTCLAQNAPALQGTAISPRLRPYPDDLLGDGLRGIDSVQLPLAAGRWKVLLWGEDTGEWEFLPHPLEQRLSVNDIPVSQTRFSPAQWYARQYLAGRAREWQPGQDAWQALGQYRGGAQLLSVQLAEPGLRLTLNADTPDGQYLSGVLAWPADDPVAEAAVQAWQVEQARQFAAQWPLQAPALAAAKDLGISVTPLADWLARPGPEPARLTGVAGSVLHYSLRIDSPQADDRPALIVMPPQQHEQSLPTQVWFGHWRLQRPQAAANTLVAAADHLRGDISALSLRPGLPRRVVVQVRVPEGSAPGIYRGQLQLASAGAYRSLPLEVEVLAIERGAPSQSVGLYHEQDPALGWFADLHSAQQLRERCDWEQLAQLGLTSLAPAMPALSQSEALPALLGRQAQLAQLGFNPRPLAYAGLKRLRQTAGDAAALQQLQSLQLQGLQAWWALADEPHAEEFADLQRFALEARRRGIALAWQLNHPSQAELAGEGDLVLLNEGYGADVDSVRREQQLGRTVWFYNLGHERLAAGFYLWRSGASGLLQWHARMPTADPFDPTDGREADFNYLWPQPLEQACQQSDVDARLIQLAAGLEDLRWLTWLDRLASEQADAAALRRRLWQAVPVRWSRAKAVSEAQLSEWRAAILTLARQDALQR